MTYAAIEASAHDGKPVLLFEFAEDATVWRYTSRGEDMSALTYTWATAPIEMGAVEQTNELSKNGLRITFPRDHAFAARFIGQVQEAITTVTVWRGHEDDPDEEFSVHWMGRVASSRLVDAKVEIECENIFTSMRRPGLRARYQKPCRHALYRRGCNLDQEDFAETAAVVSLSALVLTVDTAQPDGWFTGGMVKGPDGSLRFVMAHAGQQLTLLRAHPALAALVDGAGYGENYGNYYGGVGLTLYPGCDHLLATCNDKFANSDNNGGFPWLPTKNPFSGSSIV